MCIFLVCSLPIQTWGDNQRFYIEVELGQWEIGGPRTKGGKDTRVQRGSLRADFRGRLGGWVRDVLCDDAQFRKRNGCVGRVRCEERK